MKRVVSVMALLAASLTYAETTPVMLSLVTPLQVPSEDYDVKGLRLSLIYGDCANFTGLDIGVANRTRGEYTGLAIGGVNIAEGRLHGGQVGLINWDGNSATSWENRSIGAQVGIFNHADMFCGLQDGVFNLSEGEFSGLQTSFLNCTRDLRGVQCGWYFLLGVNIANGTVHGCQVGLVNYAETMESGCQIGFINIISHNGWTPVFPIVNGSF